MTGNKHVGDRVRLSRTLAGSVYAESREAFSDHLASQGFHISPRRLGGMERGEVDISWEDIVALVCVCETPGGADFFLPPMSPEQRKMWERAKTRTL